MYQSTSHRSITFIIWQQFFFIFGSNCIHLLYSFTRMHCFIFLTVNLGFYQQKLEHAWSSNCLLFSSPTQFQVWCLYFSICFEIFFIFGTSCIWIIFNNFTWKKIAIYNILYILTTMYTNQLKYFIFLEEKQQVKWSISCLNWNQEQLMELK